MEDLGRRLENLAAKLGLEAKVKQMRELEKESVRPNFWQDPKRARRVMRELASLQEEITAVEDLQGRIRTLQTRKHGTPLRQRLRGDAAARKEVENKLKQLETKTYLSGRYDKNNAILSVHAGAGGVEAMDWASMLARMYLRYAESKGWKTDLLEESFGEEAGIKSVTMEVKGNYAYGYLRGEAGVHRLVRLSPFDADQARHTSFAMVKVSPLIEEDLKIKIKPGDLRIEAFRSSGPGGQHMQKTESAVRITHLPTGITAVSQADRVQQRNKERALRVLKAKLYELEESKIKNQKSKLRGKRKAPAWGNQIRSYILHPYKKVVDLRTGTESKNPEEVLDGNLDSFVEAELKGWPLV